MYVRPLSPTVSERETQIDTNTDVDDVDLDEFGLDQDSSQAPPASDATRTSRTTRQTQEEPGWLRSRLGKHFSLPGFLAAIVLSTVGLLAVGAIPLFGILGIVANLLGVTVGTFVLGLASGEKRYVESGLGGGTVGLVAALLPHLPFGILGLGLVPLAIGLLGGAGAGVLGHYLGRDLRDGLTREID